MPTLNIGHCAHRSSQPKRIDSTELSEAALGRLFDWEERLGRWLGGYAIFRHFFNECSKQWSPQTTITMLDLRCGRGDLARSLAEWAGAKGLDLQILAVDRNPQAIQLAKKRHPKSKCLLFDSRTFNDPSFLQAQQFDYVIVNHAFHAETDDEAVALLKKMNLLAKRGLIVCDWIRDARACWWISGLTCLSCSDLVKEEARLSVRKGFTIGEVNSIAEKAGVDYLTVQKQFGYRFTLCGERGLVLSQRFNPVAGLARA